jgi:hypothetical protein
MFPALFRGDFITFIGGFVVLAILGIVTVKIGGAVAMLILVLFYNLYYTHRLRVRGQRGEDVGSEASAGHRRRLIAVRTAAGDEALMTGSGLLLRKVSRRIPGD